MSFLKFRSADNLSWLDKGYLPVVVPEEPDPPVVPSGVRTTSASPVRRAQEIVDIKGVTLHLTYQGTPYTDFNAVLNALDYVGIKRVRDGWGTGRDNIAALVRDQFRPRGIKLCLVSDMDDWPPGTTATQLVAYHKAYGYMQDIAFIEGDNEPGGFSPTDAALEQARSRTAAIHLAFMAEPTASHIIRGTPSLADTNADIKYQKLALNGGLPNTQAVTFHDYPGGDRMMNDTILNTLGRNGRHIKPTPSGTPLKIISTETGFSSGTTGDGGKNMPDAARPAQEVRIWLEHARGLGTGDRAIDVLLSCNYELVDQSSGADTEQAFGMFEQDWTPKPAATALRNAILLLRDPASTALSFAPTALGHTLAGASSATRSMLMQKADGAWWLAIWQQQVTWNGSTIQNPASTLR